VTRARSGASAGVSVVICAYDSQRLDLSRAAIASALAQVPRPEVVVVVDHNPELLEVFRDEFGARAVVVANAQRRGLSGARNTGLANSSGAVVAFLDDDAVAGPDWCEALIRPFADSDVVAVGGHAVPVWSRGKPGWFPDEFLWVVGCSYAGMRRSGPVRNVIGCNMAFRREVLERLGGFDLGLGRLGNKPLGCEETELCIRAVRETPGSRIELAEGCEVQHFVSADRHRLGYFFRRCVMEGISKARLRSLSGGDATRSERGQLMSVLPRAFVRYVATALRRGDVSAIGRAGALAAGTVATVAGFAWGVALPSSDSRPQPGLLEDRPSPTPKRD
jgi:glycosyltransferase involved in cell wall biosynthesis